MLNADFQRLFRKGTSKTEYAVISPTFYLTRGASYEAATFPVDKLVKARLYTQQVQKDYDLGVYGADGSPGEFENINWPGGQENTARRTAYKRASWENELRNIAPREDQKKKVYLFVIDDVNGKPAAVMRVPVAHVLGLWTAEVDERVRAATAQLVAEQNLREARAHKREEANAKAEASHAALTAGILRASEQLLNEQVRISSSLQSGWDDERDEPTFSVAGSVTVSIQGYRKLLNRISELQAQVNDRGY